MNLSSERIEAGLTVAALAREAKVDRKTVERAEAGGVITIVKATAIAKALSRVSGKRLTVQILEIRTS